jgi:hypothetical protein
MGRAIECPILKRRIGMGRITKFLAAGALAATMTAGAAQAATLGISGGISGSIPDGATNEGLGPLLLPGSLTGYYGSTINLLTRSTVTFELLGAEAGNTNTFTYIPTAQSLTDPGGGSFFNPAGIGAPISVASVLAGLLQFSFTTSVGPTTVLNGLNPDNSTLGINFFASFADAPNSREGSVLYLFFDDDGANNDDNHDDLVIRVTATPVPLPAAGFLLIGALGGLAVLRRRKTA